ncbi:MAG: ATP synthase protein I [Methyloprofundus sp.]|nr:MAG: ATP synthase protein I [Methyloprofundus sp.]
MRRIYKLSVVNKVLLGQSVIVVIVIACFFVFGDELSVKSAIYGGLAALIPNFYFAQKVSKHKGQEARKVVKSFYTGESGKLIITAAIFAMIFQDPKIDVFAVLITYVSALTVFWFALLVRIY